MSKTHVVILLHGIRDHALWQSGVAAALAADNAFVVKPLSYGRFDLLRFMFPFEHFRRQVVEKIKRDITQIRRDHPDSTFSVIAHSFGTWVIARILQETCCRFDKIIFCGSVVDVEYDWAGAGYRSDTPSILNDIGDKDPWPALARSITWGYGEAGTTAFQSPCVQNRRWANMRHGDFLKAAFCRDHWRPFLSGKPMAEHVHGGAPHWLLDFISLVQVKYVLIALLATSMWWSDAHWRIFDAVRTPFVDEEGSLKEIHSNDVPLRTLTGVERIGNLSMPYVIEVYAPYVVALEINGVKRWMSFRPQRGQARWWAAAIGVIGEASAQEMPAEFQESKGQMERVEIISTCRFACASDVSYTVILGADSEFSVVARDSDGARVNELNGTAGHLTDIFSTLKMEGLYTTGGEGIPKSKRENFSRKVAIPPGENLLVFVDATVFGSGTNGIGFTENAMYVNSGLFGHTFAVPYEQLAEAKIARGQTGYYVDIDGKQVSIAGSLIDSTQMVSIIELVRAFLRWRPSNEPSTEPELTRQRE